MRYYIILLTLVFIQPIYAQIDSAIFTSEYEKRVFQSLSDSSTPVSDLELFLALNYSQQNQEVVTTGLEQLQEYLDQKGIAKKNLKKQVKEIYEAVHSQKLTKYSLQIGFCDLFQTGKYNCVSGTAVYAFLMNHYQIPYTIKELPTHVFLIADPEGLGIKVESTLPSQGVMEYDRKTKEEFVQFLKENKLISQEEYEQGTTDEIFQKQFGEEVDISLSQLAGLEYYNEGVFAYNEKEYWKAALNLEKAYLIYPSPNVTFMLFSAYANVLNNESITGQFNGKHLATFMNRFSTDADNVALAHAYYGMALDHLIMENSNKEGFLNFHSDFMNLIADSVDLDPVLKMYHSAFGYFEYSQKNFSDALDHLNRAHMLNENDLKVKEMVQSIAGEYIFENSSQIGVVDTMDYYLAIFPFLMDNHRIKSLYAYTYAHTIYNYVTLNQISNAEESLTRMEESIPLNDLQRIEPEIVEACYLSIVYYYGDKNLDKKAIYYLNKGLAVYPNSREFSLLKKRLAYTPPVTARIVNSNPTANFNDHFPACWQAVLPQNSENNPQTVAQIEASEYAKAHFVVNGKTYEGRWAFRSKSKLLYLIPANDKDNYLMFKVVRVNESELVLRMYQGKSLQKEEVHFKVCN